MDESTKPMKPSKRGTNPRSLANLRPGNPPVDIGKHGYSLRSALKEALKDKGLRDAFIKSTLEGAMARETVPFKEVWDRIDGKVPGDGVQVNFNEIKVVVVREGSTPPQEEDTHIDET